MVDVFTFLKPSSEIPFSYQRQVYITNALAFVFAGVTLGVMAIFQSVFGWLDTLRYILLVSLLFLAVPAITRWWSHRIGRMIFCLVPVWLTMFITVYFKLTENPHTYILYFDSRFILMVTPILPGLVFRLEERLYLVICIGSSAICMMFFDLIHEMLGIGYFQMGFRDPSYYYIGYIAGIAYAVIVFGILMLRSIMERSEGDLELQNRDLVQKQHEIEAQHEELLQHQEEMVSSTEKLEEANELILQQQEALEKYNASLQALVAEKNQELLRTNEELIKYNNELIQFSYTVSHNLRGPVARLLGLARLFQVSERTEEAEHLKELVVKSSEELDTILKDLSLIIDIRNDIYRVREKVFLQDEWNKTVELLGDSLESHYQFQVNFSEAPYIYAVRPMIQSIFYNLASNAIKYQSPDRLLRVNLRSQRVADRKTEIQISDNGLGIDLKNQERNVFKLYKRFHSHVGGKGLGLYLVKTQVEALNGKISVISAPDRGATFTIMFPQPDEVSRQIFYESDAVQLYYDARLQVTVIQWKRHATSNEYRTTFERVLEALKVYKTPGWVSDARHQGVVSDEDQQWLMRNLAEEATANGLRQIALVGFDDPVRAGYFHRIESVTSERGVAMRTFRSMEEALQWMKESLN